jgi:hypothetical protein
MNHMHMPKTKETTTPPRLIDQGQPHFRPQTSLNNSNQSTPSSKLHIIIHQPHLLARLERRQPDIRAPVAPERISQRAVAARADLALHGEVDFGQVFGLQLGQVGVCVGALGGVFGVEPLRQAAAAVLAGAAALGVGFAGFGCERGMRVSFFFVLRLCSLKDHGRSRRDSRIFSGFNRSSSVSNESGSIRSARASSSLLGISMSSSSS